MVDARLMRTRLPPMRNRRFLIRICTVFNTVHAAAAATLATRAPPYPSAERQGWLAGSVWPKRAPRQAMLAALGEPGPREASGV